MILKPKCIGKVELDKAVLVEDKKHCLKIGPVGIGEKALYLNSFYIRRCYYIAWADISRVYKRIAMSKGGFSGKGIFGTMPYLVVERIDGSEKQCNFKFENEVDQVLEEIHKRHTRIKTVSAASERKLKKAEEGQEARYLKKLPESARNAVEELRKAEAFLQQDDRYSRLLVYTAKEKRSVDGMKKSSLALACTIDGLSLVSILAGLYLRLGPMQNEIGTYLILFGIAFIITIAASQALPTPRRNKRTVQKDWEEALSSMQKYLKKYGNFPVPAQYAHPIVLERMIRVIREGRAKTAEEALEVVKKDLKALNNTVKVSQQEYDEVTAVKPIFLVCNYQ